jgi:hypothetical protein
MTRSVFPRFLLAASLALLLSMPSLAAGPQTPPRGHHARISNPVTEALRQLWNYVAGALTKEGCGIDPNGRCVTSTSGISAPDGSEEAGCGIDPSGRCLQGGLAPASLDAGCGLDPSGRCMNGN